jgi:hypothetical protein
MRLARSVNVPAAAAWAVSKMISAGEVVGFFVGKPQALNRNNARQRAVIINNLFCFMVPSFLV